MIAAARANHGARLAGNDRPGGERRQTNDGEQNLSHVLPPINLPDGDWKSSRFLQRGRSADLAQARLEQNPKKLIDFFDKTLLQLFESGAISYRPDDSVWSESA
jgi:hypothetical protein